ncbi:MAG TPA: histidine kinase dimerization/phosphoacceptor domain -containing protein [Sphingopyxis sp.]|uniref:sensor histidine kinase n=1 Tax=Sphingopyxis sp. TaxID=1908224 RepID=UPI002B5163E6|nr:histidine kinase dimerization/phosphoacceptor domain -containing protein [Sphingopyxis sp.]HWW56328.1 histidine kinase dimerization/phosphoacceptor domain -containing protein [Sphingopyxis sp.]
MAADTPPINLHRTLGLAMALASDAPLLLLDENLAIVAASDSFCSAFGIDPETVTGQTIYDLDHRHWDLPRLHSLIDATLSGAAEVEAYEIEIETSAGLVRCVVIKAQRLDYGDGLNTRMMVTVIDVTEERQNEKRQQELIHANAALLHEMQHRVANSLQIIASILMQSARKVQSTEARGHLSDAHQRVMSIATLQRHLAGSDGGQVELEPYLAQLCASIGASMIYDRDQLTLITKVDPVSIGGDVSVSMGLVVTELVINALKHAFPDGRPGHVVVGYAGKGDNWILSVSDDGVGMDENAERSQAGLGTRIVQALAKQLGAEISVDDAAPGTRVALTRTAQIARQIAANDEAEIAAV